jgi:hypothetical protein
VGGDREKKKEEKKTIYMLVLVLVFGVGEVECLVASSRCQI